MFRALTRRIENSDVKAGSYLIVTSEAMRGDPQKDDVNKKGFLIDKTKKPDAFGHYQLMGAAKKTRRELSDRLLADPSAKQFMKKNGLFIPGQYEVPEVRAIRPTHLMRCGRTSAYDVNFGRVVGSGAVLLLLEGISGGTVAGTRFGEIQYIPIKKAIKQRPVDLHEVALYEMQGLCFGRPPQEYEPKLKKIRPENVSRPF